MESAVELQAVADLYSNMMKSCQKKCLVQSLLNKTLDDQENKCNEMCVQKYLRVHQQVGVVMQNTQPEVPPPKK